MGRMRTQLNFNSDYHPQVDGQTYVANYNLDNLLQNLVGDKPK
jgi:hypothetical protein